MVRSTRVAIADWLWAPVMRSPSQFPGPARSLITGGRPEIMTIRSTNLGVRCLDLAFESARSLDVEGLINGLWAHAHLRLSANSSTEVRLICLGDQRRSILPFTYSRRSDSMAVWRSWAVAAGQLPCDALRGASSPSADRCFAPACG